MRKQLTLLILVCSLFFLQYKYLEFKFSELTPVCPILPDSLQCDCSPDDLDPYAPIEADPIVSYNELYAVLEGERTYQSEYPRLLL
jgi:hypothetical protein